MCVCITVHVCVCVYICVCIYLFSPDNLAYFVTAFGNCFVTSCLTLFVSRSYQVLSLSLYASPHYSIVIVLDPELPVNQ